MCSYSVNNKSNSNQEGLIIKNVKNYIIDCELNVADFDKATAAVSEVEDEVHQ